MSFFRTASIVAPLLFMLTVLPGVASAQTAVYSRVVVTTQLARGVVTPAVLPTVTVQAQGPSFSTMPVSGTTTLSYTSNFLGEVRTVTFVPGNYLVMASVSGYYLAYSPDCAGTTAVGALNRSCVITLTNTPSTPNPCIGYTYGCVAPVTPYVGPIYPHVSQ